MNRKLYFENWWVHPSRKERAPLKNEGHVGQNNLAAEPTLRLKTLFTGENNAKNN